MKRKEVVTFELILVYIITFFVFFPSFDYEIVFGSFGLNCSHVIWVLMGIVLLKKNVYIDRASGFYFYMIWVIYSVIQLLYVQSKTSAMAGCVKIFACMFYALYLIVVFVDRKEYIKLIKCIALFIFIHNIIGWYEIFFHKYNFVDVERRVVLEQASIFQPVSMFYNLNDYSTIMVLGICLQMIFCIKSNKQAISVFWKIVIVSELIQIVGAGSRGALLGVILGVGTTLFFLQKKEARRIEIILSFPVIALALAVGIRILLKFFIYTPNGERSDIVRINLIKNAFVFLKQSKGLGIGLFNFVSKVSNNAVYDTVGIFDLHNWWMEILVSSGIVIFVLYIRFYINSIKNMIKNIEFNEVSYGLISFMAAYTVASISSSNNMSKAWVQFMFAFIIAYQNLCLKTNKISIENVKDFVQSDNK